MINFEQLQVLFLVFARLTAFSVAAPFFSIRNVPPLVKVGFGVVLTLLVYPLMGTGGVALPSTLLGYGLEAVGEVLVGLALGFIATLTFTAIKVAGELGDLQMGFAMTGLMDPLTGSRTSLMGEYLYMLGILLFLIINGHHTLILALVGSFELVPVGVASVNGGATAHVIGVFTGMFALGLRIAAPILAVLLISDLALGMVARTVPQLNVFILGFPLKVALGMLTLSLAAPLMAAVVGTVFTQMERDLAILMGSLR
ncbi:hypothetical protein SY88_04035 [Clostridiales bacterium PH28_bin88]|nr:hypothetical protein SY88_04035 [Clostridiales bacterium PH28_bin88]